MRCLKLRGSGLLKGQQGNGDVECDHDQVENKNVLGREYASAYDNHCMSCPELHWLYCCDLEHLL